MRVRLHASQGTVCGFSESDLRKRQEKKKFHKHIYIIRVTDILKFFEVLFCTYRKVLSLKNCRYAYIPPYMNKTLPTLRNEKEQ